MARKKKKKKPAVLIVPMGPCRLKRTGAGTHGGTIQAKNRRSRKNMRKQLRNWRRDE